MPTQTAIYKQIGVQVSFPVIPQTPGIIIQPGHHDAATTQSLFGFAIVKLGRVIHKLHHIRWQAQVLHNMVGNPSDRWQHPQALFDRRRDVIKYPGIDTHGHLRSMRCIGKNIEHLSNTFGLWIGQVETLAIKLRFVGKKYRGVNDIINRHNIDPTTFQTQGRHPGRQHLAHFLDQFEKVIRAINLVNYTCF